MKFTEKACYRLLLAACLIVTGSSQVLSSNLIENSGFESGLSGWSPYQYASGWVISTDAPHGGANCLSFTFPGGAGYYDASVRLTDPIPVSAGVNYRFSFWIKELNTHDTWTSDETILDNTVTVAGETHYLYHSAPSAAWQLVSGVMAFEVSGDASIELQLHGYATDSPALFEIDDIEFCALSGWCDDFESYVNAGDWATNWHGSGNSSAITLDNTTFTSGVHSLKMFGQIGSCWAAVATRPIAMDLPLEVSFAMKSGTETIYGCHPYRGVIGLRTGGPDWWNCPCPQFIVTLPSGDIRIPTPAGPVDFAGYALNQWYNYRLILSHPGDNLLHVRIWVDDDYLGEFTWPHEAWMMQSAYLDISSQEGTAWFDDVCVSSAAPVLTARTSMSPNLIQSYWAFAVNPISVTAFIGELSEDDYDVQQIDFTSIRLNQTISPLRHEILPFVDGYVGSVLAVDFPVSALVLPHLPIYGTITVPYEVDGFLNDGRQFAAIGEVSIKGKRQAIGELELFPTLREESDQTILPTEYALAQNQPNPFNPSTDIIFSLPAAGQARLAVYNMLGQEVAVLADATYPAGVHRVVWTGCDAAGAPVASGVYLYRLTAGDFAATKKMVLMK